MNLAFLASHGGTNLQAVVDACKSGQLPCRPCVIISNNRESGALQRAEREGIPGFHLSSVTHPDPTQLDEAILRVLTGHASDLVILAGYMRKLGPKTLDRFRDHVINIHPALLPKFGGQGMFGIHVHRAVLEAGEVESGATVHLVDGEYDRGAILSQRRVPVLAGDTEDTLAQRVLCEEHGLLVETIGRIAAGELLSVR